MVTGCKERGAEGLFWGHFTALGTCSAPLEQSKVQVLLLCRDSAPGTPDAVGLWGGGGHEGNGTGHLQLPSWEVQDVDFLKAKQCTGLTTSERKQGMLMGFSA